MSDIRKTIIVEFVFDSEDKVEDLKINTLPYPFSYEMITNMIQALKEDEYLSALKNVKRVKGKFDSSFF